jgi:hypothetical protein
MLVNLVLFIISLNRKIITRKACKFEKNVIGGYDGRYNSDVCSETNDALINKIKVFHFKFELLKALENNETSLITKLNLITENDLEINKYLPNITAGGLFKDWNFYF